MEVIATHLVKCQALKVTFVLIVYQKAAQTYSTERRFFIINTRLQKDQVKGDKRSSRIAMSKQANTTTTTNTRSSMEKIKVIADLGEGVSQCRILSLPNKIY